MIWFRCRKGLHQCRRRTRTNRAINRASVAARPADATKRLDRSRIRSSISRMETQIESLIASADVPASATAAPVAQSPIGEAEPAVMVAIEEVARADRSSRFTGWREFRGRHSNHRQCLQGLHEEIASGEQVLCRKADGRAVARQGRRSPSRLRNTGVREFRRPVATDFWSLWRTGQAKPQAWKASGVNRSLRYPSRYPRP